jgi:hypothetical protein
VHFSFYDLFLSGDSKGIAKLPPVASEEALNCCITLDSRSAQKFHLVDIVKVYLIYKRVYDNHFQIALANHFITSTLTKIALPGEAG